MLEKFISPEPNSGCWLWTGAVNPHGYGQITIDGQTVRAHRVSYEAYKGKIPGRSHVLHKCDIPSCVNPEHLFLGTHQDNMRDMKAKGRHKVLKGQDSKSSKLTDSDVVFIRKNHGYAAELAITFNVSKRTIEQIQRGQTWKHLLPVTT